MKHILFTAFALLTACGTQSQPQKRYDTRKNIPFQFAQIDSTTETQTIEEDTTEEPPKYDVTIEYKQLIEGYKIVLNGYVYDMERVEYVNGILSLIKNRDTINIEVDHFGDSCVLYKKIDRITRLDYSAPKRDEMRFRNKSKLPFVFADVDFDGQKELLINDWYNGQVGNNYSVYKITERATEAEYPFTILNDIDSIDYKNRALIKYNGNSWNYLVIVYKKDLRDITATIQPLETMNDCAIGTIEVMNTNKRSRYKVESFSEFVRQVPSDLEYHYKRKGNKIVLVKTDTIK